jgi:hypothetical protein
MKHLLTLTIQVKQKDAAWISDRDRYKILNAMTDEEALRELEAAVLKAIPEPFREGVHITAE